MVTAEGVALELDPVSVLELSSEDDVALDVSSDEVVVVSSDEEVASELLVELDVSDEPELADVLATVVAPSTGSLPERIWT